MAFVDYSYIIFDRILFIMGFEFDVVILGVCVGLSLMF